MANFSSFTLNNHGVTDLNKVIFDTVFKYGNLFNTCTAKNGVKNGEKADYVDQMSDLGWAGRGCNPTYVQPTITGRESTWALGDWSAPIKMCYHDLEATIANWSLKTGTNRDDLTGTDFYDKIFMPLFVKALERMYWRMAWFGDTNAKLVANSGVLKAGTDITLFKAADGLWKRIFAQVATNSAQKTTISANAQSTYATQISGIRTTGAAIAVVEGILADANSLIEGGVLLMTKSLVDALRIDYRKEYKATIPFYEVAEGVKLEQFDGVSILPVPEWDTVIRAFEDDGTKWNNPHRAVFTNVENLLVGTSDKNMFAELTSGFDDKARENYNYIASNIGTLLNNPELFQAAY